MWTGMGPRKASWEIKFSEAFAAQPLVHVSLTMWDMGSDSNARVIASWLAIGGVADPEQWDIY